MHLADVGSRTFVPERTSTGRQRRGRALWGQSESSPGPLGTAWRLGGRNLSKDTSPKVWIPGHGRYRRGTDRGGGRTCDGYQNGPGRSRPVGEGSDELNDAVAKFMTTEEDGALHWVVGREVP